MFTSIAITILSLINSPAEVEDVRDITFRVPHFDNAPRFRMNGATPFGQPRQRPTVANIEEKLADILVDLYGDEYDIRTWNGHIIYNRRRR